MERITDLIAMQEWAAATRAAGRRIGFVPTMGALHEGHLVLVRRAAELADAVVVSVFVNPIQFDRRDDFEGYPRDLARDAQLLTDAGVAVVFTPAAAAMYGPGFQSHVEVEGVTAPLCGAQRPGHFRGVTTVVSKLFHLVQPHVAVFGEKDYQQLVTIQRMVADLCFDVEIVGVPTVRERDGLALSSRNRRLGAAERAAARCVPRALRAAVDLAAAGDRTREGLLAAARREVEAEPLARIEYAELRHPETLEEVATVEDQARLAVAVWVGEVRLIDNCLIAVSAPAVAVGAANGNALSTAVAPAADEPAAAEPAVNSRNRVATTDGTSEGGTA
jgi:pantoate--beta-alanine ligase